MLTILVPAILALPFGCQQNETGEPGPASTDTRERLPRTKPRFYAPVGRNIDWEAELAIVVGKPARHLTLENAHDHVFDWAARNPREFLKPGDVVEIEIEGIGKLITPMKATTAPATN
jgi:2-keto-4-pentenoate hydratase/2-oxohepta-3-ene-1,7-dioic acid hydratase in catechol pathway